MGMKTLPKLITAIDAEIAVANEIHSDTIVLTVAEGKAIKRYLEDAETSWIDEKDRKRHWHCAKCGYVVGIAGFAFKHCPECGRIVKRDG